MMQEIFAVMIMVGMMTIIIMMKEVTASWTLEYINLQTYETIPT